MSRLSLRLALPSSSKPRERTSPLCSWQRPLPQRCVGSGSSVGTLVWVRSKTDAVMKLLLPGGWYLMPISYCLPSVGLNTEPP
ncbi:hypothetical protein D9M68_978620 [compost metagenome]